MRDLLQTTIPRPQLLALALLVTLAAAPHAFNLHPLVSGFFLLVVGVRLLLYQRRWRMPGRLVKFIFTVAGIASVLVGEHSLVGQRGGVALLTVMLGLKLLEVKARRDLYVTIFLTFFLGITQFLFDTGMLVTLYELLVVAGLTGLLVEMHRVQPSASPWLPLRTAVGLIAQALPIMVILFVLFPRVTSPLWDLRLGGSDSVTGLSDRMAPGSVSRLSESDEVAFRVEFTGPTPPPEQRYWRGPVFWHMDGREWTVGFIRRIDGPDYRPIGEPVSYVLTMEPTGQRWLFALDLPGAVPYRGHLTDDYQLMVDGTVRQRRRYSIYSHPRFDTGELSAIQQDLGTRLPYNITPRMRELVAGWQAADPSPAAVVESALRHFNRQPFIYTLTPPLLGTNPADEFLFESRSGFCEHYASAFVLLMRIAGVPSRVVTGYLGAELNPIGGYYIVRQSHAHAWAEVWLQGQGWVRVDPTSAVAPERVVNSIDLAGLREGSPVTFRSGDQPLFGRLARETALLLDAINSDWNQWILGYGDDKQAALLRGLGLGFMQYRGMVVGTVVLVLGVLLLVAWRLARRGMQATDAARRVYDRFCGRLARRGLVRAPAEGPLDFAQRVAAKRPELAAAVRRITGLYLQIRYGPGGDLERLRRLVRGFRP